MNQDNYQKKIIKTTLYEFFNEQVSSKKYKVGEKVWYKNQYMNNPELVKIDDVEEYADNEIYSITIKFDSGNIDKLLKHQFKYLSKEKQTKDLYTIIKEIGNQISNIINYPPNQILGLFNFIKNNDKNGNFKISFTEEVKDDRTPKFNTNLPLKLMGNTVGSEFKFKIVDIKYIKSYKEESEYNDYIKYVYNVTFQR